MLRPTRIRDKNMLPGNPDLLKCPFCGEEKEVMTLLSGNTVNGQQWSDVRSIYPMLPHVSPIQKCPSCGKYYFTSNVERKESTDGFCLETGELTYEELKEAAIQFGDGLSQKDRNMLDMLLLWAFNDKYNREDMEIQKAPKEEQDYINVVLDELLATSNADDIVRAEYLRERGLFEKAIALLDTCHPEGAFLVDIVERMKSYALEKNKIAFKI